LGLPYYFQLVIMREFRRFLSTLYVLDSPLYSNSRITAHNWTSSFARLAFVLLLAPLAIEEDCLPSLKPSHQIAVSNPRGGGALPYMGYIGMRRCEGHGFQAV